MFRALPLPKTTHMVYCGERKSAPPKITQPKAFALSTDRRGSVQRTKLPIEAPQKTFKSRPMPQFPEPPSP